MVPREHRCHAAHDGSEPFALFRSCGYIRLCHVGQERCGIGYGHRQVHDVTTHDFIVASSAQEPSRSTALLGPACEGTAHQDDRQAGQDCGRGKEALGVACPVGIAPGHTWCHYALVNDAAGAVHVSAPRPSHPEGDSNFSCH